MDKRKLDIVFLGEDTFSNVILQSLITAGHHVKLVITPWYDNLVYKKLEHTCTQNNIPFSRNKKINSEETIQQIKEVQPDLGVIAHFERLIKQPIIEIPRMGFINLHPSLLPDYRGMAPQHWPIINREKETGITVHYVDETADTGNIILQRHIPMTEEMYVSDLQRIWQKEYQTIMVEAIECILSHRPTKEQKYLEGRYYGKLKLEQCFLSPDMHVADAFSLIRGVSLPYFGARYNDMIIYRAHIKQLYEETSAPVIHFIDGDLVIDMYK